MERKQLAEKAIKKAIDYGWQQLMVGEFTEVLSDPVTGELFAVWVYVDDEKAIRAPCSVASIIFSHSFAETLWGQKGYDKQMADQEKWKSKGLTVPRAPQYKDWQINLMRMVVADDPIKYLGDNI